MNELIVKQLEAEEVSALERVEGWSIQNNDDYSGLDAYCKGLLGLKKKITDDFRESKDAAFAAHRAICKQESGHLDAVEKAIKIGKVKLFTWDKAQEAIRRAEEERLRAAEKMAADEAALRAAEAAQKSGDTETATAIVEEAISAAAPVIIIPNATPKRTTIIRMAKKFRIINPVLIKREFLMPDEQKIGATIRAMGKMAETVVGGIEFYEVPC